jgi:peptidoglycan DL-endopeptidase LytE
MANKVHNAWGVLTAIWLTIAPSHAQANQTFRQQTVALPTKTVTAVRASAAVCANPYTVRRGDTLAKIARRCGVSIAYLKRVNGLSGDTIRVGQTLVTRASRSKAPKVTPAPTPTIESPVSPW